MNGFDWSYLIPIVMIGLSLYAGICYCLAAKSYSKRVESSNDSSFVSINKSGCSISNGGHSMDLDNVITISDETLGVK